MEARVEPRSFHALTVSRWTNSTMNNGVIGASQGDELHCTGCQKPIRERYLLKALEQFWHEDCLKCACCECRLGEVGSTLFTKSNLILCKRDYLRLFGTTGLCCACEKGIPAFEMVMRAKENVYHLDCFACQQCNLRFCVGDRFFLHENRILCETDYEAVRRNSTSNSPRLPWPLCSNIPKASTHPATAFSIPDEERPQDRLSGSREKPVFSTKLKPE